MSENPRAEWTPCYWAALSVLQRQDAAAMHSPPGARAGGLMTHQEDGHIQEPAREQRDAPRHRPLPRRPNLSMKMSPRRYSLGGRNSSPSRVRAANAGGVGRPAYSTTAAARSGRPASTCLAASESTSACSTPWMWPSKGMPKNRPSCPRATSSTASLSPSRPTTKAGTRRRRTAGLSHHMRRRPPWGFSPRATRQTPICRPMITSKVRRGGAEDGLTGARQWAPANTRSAGQHGASFRGPHAQHRPVDLRCRGYLRQGAGADGRSGSS